MVSDTSDRTHLGQEPSLARGFVGVSDSTITSFSRLLIEIDTFEKNVQAYKKEGPKFLQRLCGQAEGQGQRLMTLEQLRYRVGLSAVCP